MKATSRHPDGSVKSFEVVGTIAIKRKGELRVSKKHADPEKAVLLTIDALEKQVRRWSEKRERSRATLGKSLKSVRSFKMEVSG